MPTITERIESEHARQLRVDTMRATALRMGVQDYRAQRAAAVKKWAHTLHTLMEAAGVSDPVEVMPEICASIMQHAVLEARKAAVAEARTEVQKMLRKVMS
jgi:hypothetical protein